MKIKKVMLGLLTVGAVVSLAACSSNSGSSSSATGKVATVNKGQLTIAVSPDYPPFEYKAIVNGKDSDVGVDIDIAKQIAKDMGVKLNISNMDFDNVLGSVANSKSDLAISGITETKEREKTFDFSEAYYTPVNEIVIKKSELNKYKSFSDFKGKVIAGQTGSTQVDVIKQYFTNANLVQLPNVDDNINEVKAGKVAATVIDSMPAESYVAKNPDLAIAKVKIPVAKDANTAIAIKKGNKGLLKKVNATIQKLKKSGKLDKIFKEDYAASQETAK